MDQKELRDIANEVMDSVDEIGRVRDLITGFKRRLEALPDGNQTRSKLAAAIQRLDGAMEDVGAASDLLGEKLEPETDD